MEMKNFILKMMILVSDHDKPIDCTNNNIDETFTNKMPMIGKQRISKKIIKKQVNFVILIRILQTKATS